MHLCPITIAQTSAASELMTSRHVEGVPIVAPFARIRPSCWLPSPLALCCVACWSKASRPIRPRPLLIRPPSTSRRRKTRPHQAALPLCRSTLPSSKSLPDSVGGRVGARHYVLLGNTKLSMGGSSGPDKCGGDVQARQQTVAAVCRLGPALR